MRIGFFVDGDNAIGMGHVYRCLALARALLGRCPGTTIEMHTRADSPAREVLADAARRGLRLGIEDDTTSGGDDAFDVLVVDRLAMPADWLADLRRHCRCLVSLDDTGPGHFVADLAINGLYHPRVARPAGSVTDSRLGFEYLILDPAFAAARTTTRPEVTDVYLTQGGADTWGLTARLVEALAPWLAAHPAITVHVKTGPAFADETRLAAALRRSPGRWHRHGRVDTLVGLMAGMDVALTAAGITAFELLAAGVPCLIVTDEDKEQETAARLHEAGLAVSFGRFHAGLGARLAAELDRLASHATRAAMAQRTRAAIDGRGADRIVDLILAHPARR